MLKTCKIPVREVVLDTPEVKTVRLSLEGTGFTFIAGQFIMVNVELDHEGLRRKERRAYSISSSPDHKDYLDITVKKEDGGKVSTYLHNLNKGDIVEIDGPYGHFTLQDAQNVVYIGAGTGIAPLMSMARYACAHALPLAQVLLYTVRKSSDIIFKDEILAMPKKYKNIQTFITVTRPEEGDGWKGATGRIDEGIITSLVHDVHASTYYLCGSPALVKAMKDLLFQMKIDPGKIRQEVFVGTTD